MSSSRRSRPAADLDDVPAGDAPDHRFDHDGVVAVAQTPSLRASPAAGIVLSAAGVLLAWQVVTVSLPYALASFAPEAALILNSTHPAALVAKAESLRADLFALADTVVGDETPTEADSSRNDESTSAEEAKTARAVDERPRSATGAPPPPLVASVSEDAGERAIARDRLRREIKLLARRALSVDPLNAAAYRLLGEVAGDSAETRAMMVEAVRRSRRETVALYWLFTDAIARGEHRTAVGHADILFRTRPEIAAYVTSHLAEVVADRAGNAMLVEKLATNPPWREAFLKTLPRALKTAEPGLDLMIGLKNAGAPPSDVEIAPLLDVLIRSNLVEMAYGAWLQLLPARTTESLGLLVNPSFETAIGGSPFDWRLTAATNAVAEVVERDDKRKQRALQVTFLPGRSRFSGVEQIVLLAAGEYQMTGVMRGKVVAKRGLKWRVDCLYGNREMLAMSEPLTGTVDAWRRFTFDFAVPERQECRAQRLRLVLDARSPSEELVSGEIVLDELKLSRTGDLRPEDAKADGTPEVDRAAQAPLPATGAIRRRP